MSHVDRRLLIITLGIDALYSSILQHIVLVGGFAASDWLYQCTHNVLSKLGYIVLRPDYYVWANFQPPSPPFMSDSPRRNKAVSDGAIHFYLGHNVHARRSKIALGADVDILYEPRNSSHIARLQNSRLNAAGERVLASFWTLLQKVCGLLSFHWDLMCNKFSRTQESQKRVRYAIILCGYEHPGRNWIIRKTSIYMPTEALQTMLKPCSWTAMMQVNIWDILLLNILSLFAPLRHARYVYYSVHHWD